MTRALSRLFVSLAFGGLLLLGAPSGVAHADDASADGGGNPSDAAQSTDDAATVTHCTANGNPCSSSKECCEGAYCGAFSASSGSDVCGSETPMAISTSSCALTRSSGSDGLALAMLIGCAVGIGARRRRRQA